MHLKVFIQKLQEIEKFTDADNTLVQMADTISVVEPILKNGVVFITDERDKIQKTRKTHGTFQY